METFSPSETVAPRRPGAGWLEALRAGLDPVAGWLGRTATAAAVAAIGILLGVQYVHPNKRVIAVLSAIAVAGTAWRLDLVWGVGLLVLAVPFPRGTVFGNSNLALVLILLVLWLLRVTLRMMAPPRRTPLDLPVVGLLIAFIVSFNNLEKAEYLEPAMQNIQLLLACVLMFYLIVSTIRTERDLRRFHVFQAVSLFSICLVALYELGHPGQSFIPGWINFPEIHGETLNLKNYRVGGPFLDFELLAEFCAMNLLLLVFLFARAGSKLQLALFGALFLFCTFVLFATVTRGAFLSLGTAVTYLLWTVRRKVRFVPLVAGLMVGAGVFLAMNFYVANFTSSGDTIERLSKTYFVGLVPDDRVQAWGGAWERFLEHPIIGHGPFYSQYSGTRLYFWPHNGYLLVANIAGAVGLGFFLWILGRLWWISRPLVDTLRHPSYAASFLIVAHAQLVLFLVDQMKIDFLRNQIYVFEVWILFASITAAHLIASDQRRAGQFSTPRP
jgi:O-antigen ligase